MLESKQCNLCKTTIENLAHASISQRTFTSKCKSHRKKWNTEGCQVWGQKSSMCGKKKSNQRQTVPKTFVRRANSGALEG